MRCSGGHDERLAENCVAVCSGSVAEESSEGGFQERCCPPQVAHVFEWLAGVCLPDLHFLRVLSSLAFAEWNSELLQHPVVGSSEEEVQGLEHLAVDCLVYAVEDWVEQDQCYLSWDGMKQEWYHYFHWQSVPDYLTGFQLNSVRPLIQKDSLLIWPRLGLGGSAFYPQAHSIALWG